MAWKVSNGVNLRMSEGDFGVALEYVVSVDGVTFGASDNFRFTFKDIVNGKTILTKTYSDISNSTIALCFTKAESALFPPGAYVYSLDWYQGDDLQLCLVDAAAFTVGDVA